MKTRLDLFLGPCVIESEQMALDIAHSLREVFADKQDRVKLHFKASFDKANRSSVKSFRGPGLEKGLMILEKVKKQTGLPLMVDFHVPDQAIELAKVVDILQIPAFLCRQTDMIIAAAEACKANGRQLNVKKGQFLSPEETSNIVEKVKELLSLDALYLTERGTLFGYNNLIVDMASFQIMKSFGVKTIYDATHSIQKPGGHGTYTAGKKDQLLVLAKAAMAAGADGLFMEVHPEPSLAKSDKATCLELSLIKKFVETILPFWEINQN
jgi:2-dehydro-3-deoxyphosphooctonate aldolase (KDO 8-P synthase)